VTVSGHASLSELARSAPHSLIRGLRLTGHEAQLTQVIAAVAGADRVFASRFVQLVLVAAERHGRQEGAVGALGDVPVELKCVAEHALYDREDRTLGRVDLRFDSQDFTLLIENKLHSHFGDEQLRRYEAALALLPAGRAGLVAITRNVPSRSELEVFGRGWLGAVRWTHLVDGMRHLPIADTAVAAQWPLLLDVLEAQGDLGVTSVDTNLVHAWARYLDGRAVLTDLMDAIRERALDLIGDQLARRYPDYGPATRLCAPLAVGKSLVAVKREQQVVSTAYAVPAREQNDAVVRLQFWMDRGEALFGLRIAPYDGLQRVRRTEPQLAAAAALLLKAGFRDRRGCWWSEHRSPEFLDSDDVPERLLEIVARDMRAVADSDILLVDVKRARRRLRPA
jgi:hypothetical protein